MPRGGKAGSGLRGGRPAVDPDGPAYDFRGWRIADGSRIYLAGNALSYGPSVGAPAQNRLYVMPEIFPRAGRITKLYQVPASSTNSQVWKLRLGVYSNRAGGFYPDRLLADGGEYSAQAAVGTFVPFTVSVSVPANTLLWFAMIGSNIQPSTGQNVQLCYVQSRATHNWMGFADTETTVTFTPAVTWYHNETYGPLPTTFPSSAPVIVKDAGALFWSAFYNWIE